MLLGSDCRVCSKHRSRLAGAGGRPQVRNNFCKAPQDVPVVLDAKLIREFEPEFPGDLQDRVFPQGLGNLVQRSCDVRQEHGAARPIGLTGALQPGCSKVLEFFTPLRPGSIKRKDDTANRHTPCTSLCGRQGLAERFDSLICSARKSSLASAVMTFPVSR